MPSASRNPLDYATPPAPAPPDGGRAAAGWLFVAMLLAGLACPWQALMLFDVGRGSWLVPISCIALVGSPLSAVAWTMRRGAGGKWVASVLVAAAALADLAAAAAPRLDGTDHFRLHWSSDRSYLIGWFATWGIWQLLALAALVAPRVPARPLNR